MREVYLYKLGPQANKQFQKEFQKNTPKQRQLSISVRWLFRIESKVARHMRALADANQPVDDTR